MQLWFFLHQIIIQRRDKLYSPAQNSNASSWKSQDLCLLKPRRPQDFEEIRVRIQLWQEGISICLGQLRMSFSKCESKYKSIEAAERLIPWYSDQICGGGDQYPVEQAADLILVIEKPHSSYMSAKSKGKCPKASQDRSEKDLHTLQEIRTQLKKVPGLSQQRRNMLFMR